MYRGSLIDKNGVWQMVIYHYENGKRKFVWETTHLSKTINRNKGKAQRMLDDRLRELNTVPSGDDFVEFMGEWLTDIQRRVRPNTYNSYALVVNTHLIPYFQPLDLDIQSVKIIHIQEYCDTKLDQGLTVNTVIKHRANLCQIFKLAIRRELIVSNPTEGVVLPVKKKHVPTFYNVNQIEKLIRLAKGDPIESAVVLASHFGLRREEVLGLRWSDIDLDEGVMTIRHTAVQYRGSTLYQDTTKTKASNRSYPVTGSIREYLIALRRHQDSMRELYGSDYIQNDYVVKWDTGKLMRPDTLSSRFKRLIEDNGLPPLTFHGLRHSCASILIGQGCSLKQIQDWLGHEDIQTTADIYSHLEYKSKTGLANIMDSVINGKKEET